MTPNTPTTQLETEGEALERMLRKMVKLRVLNLLRSGRVSAPWLTNRRLRGSLEALRWNEHQVADRVSEELLAQLDPADFAFLPRLDEHHLAQRLARISWVERVEAVLAILRLQGRL